MNKEFNVILSVVQVNKDEKLNENIDQIISKDLDWKKILGELFYHRIAGYFYNGLTEKQFDKVPRDVKNALRLYTNAVKIEQKKRFNLVKKVLNILNKNDISYATLKGLSFLFEFYPLGIKQSNDFDIWVIEEDLNKLDTCMRRLGFIQSNLNDNELVEASKREKIIQRLNYHDLVPYVYDFRKDKSGTKVGAEDILVLDVNFVFASHQNVEMDKEIYKLGLTNTFKEGLMVKSLNHYVHLLFLCIHFYREATNTLWTKGVNDIKLYKIIDINNLLNVHKNDFDIKHWCILVQKYGLEKECYLTFSVLNDAYPKKQYEECLNILRPDDIGFINEIVVEGENRKIRRSAKIFDIIINS